jgi:hypothetical protein
MVALNKKNLAEFTDKRKRSQLAPHRKLIMKLHQNGCTFRGIASILSEDHHLTVAPSTVFRFIARLEQERSNAPRTRQRKGKSLPAIQPEPEKPVVDRAVLPSTGKTLPYKVGLQSDEVRQRVEELQHRPIQFEPTKPKFVFDSDQPLHLEPQEGKK